MNEPIYFLQDDMWETIQKGYFELLQKSEDVLLRKLKDGFLCEDEELQNHMTVFEENVYENTKKEINRLFRDLNGHLLRKYELRFSKLGLTRSSRKTRMGRIATGRRSRSRK